MSHIRNCKFTTSVEIITLLAEGGGGLCMSAKSNTKLYYIMEFLSFRSIKKENILCLFSDTRMVFLVFNIKL